MSRVLRLALFLFLLFAIANCRVKKPKKSTIDQLRQEFIEFEDSLWAFNNDIKENDNPEVKLITQYQNFGDKLQERAPHDNIPQLETILAYAYVEADLRGINALYDTFRRFQRKQTETGRIPSPKEAWIDLSEEILNKPSTRVKDALINIHNSIHGNFLSKFLKEVEGDLFCGIHQSPQQVLYSLYNAIALSELKGYTMIQFAYMLKKLYGEGNFTLEAHLSRMDYENRTKAMLTAFKKSMEKSSQELWRCDPEKHVEGETYEEVTKLLQGYIQNEVDLNSEGTCRESCSEYSYTKSHGCFKNLWCESQKRCQGKIINCRFIDSDMWICPSTDPQRRYEYVEYENGRTLGRKQGCRRGTTKVDSWWRWLFWHCSYCFCLCDEQGSDSDRYINLRSMKADIGNNKVVTGLRFVKHNRIVHLQVQQGTLLPRGNIDNSSVEWLPVEDYKITDKDIYNGQDYHTLTWEKRAVDLDDLIADEGHLVTGIRFKMIGSHLNFEILTTPFDFESGRLIDPETKSYFKDQLITASSPKPRTRLRLINPDVSIRTPAASLPDSRNNTYVEFTNTDLDRDAAQTTVPFFDAQKVESLQPVPLSGAGIFHKGRNNFGGFIAPKIITYDYSKHLEADFSIEPEVN